MGMIDSNYERVQTVCDGCDKVNIYSRVSDLRTVASVDGKSVSCQQCGKELWISGDTMNPAYQMLLLDAHQLRDEKRYMYCILNICQSYEMFFVLYFRSLLYRACVNEPDTDRLNTLLAKLYNVTAKFTFPTLRSNFLRHAVSGSAPASLDEAQGVVDSLRRHYCDAAECDLSPCLNAELRAKLEIIKATDIHCRRNNVVHKHGYRPSLEEVNRCLEEAEGVLFVLPGMLGVRGDEPDVYRFGV
jgi:RNase P subunit RPR2